MMVDSAVYRRQYQLPEYAQRRTYVRWEIQIARLRVDRCPRCDLSLVSSAIDVRWLICPCCERRYRTVPDGWEEQRLTVIIGRCEHGA